MKIMNLETKIFGATMYSSINGQREVAIKSANFLRMKSSVKRGTNLAVIKAKDETVKKALQRKITRSIYDQISGPTRLPITVPASIS